MLNVVLLVVFSVLPVIRAQTPYHTQPVAILNEQRYLSGDGKFGAQYSQEDGVQYKEESEADGTRRGSYSYIDPTGQRRTISFTAGKHGFQASGDGIPTPLPTVLPTAPQPQYVPQPQYQSPEYAAQPQPQPVQYAAYHQPQQLPHPQPIYQIGQPQGAAYQISQPQAVPPQFQQPAYQAIPQQFPATTSAPHRFYPPGKLSLNRSPDGFSYTFQKA